MHIIHFKVICKWFYIYYKYVLCFLPYVYTKQIIVDNYYNICKWQHFRDKTSSGFYIFLNIKLAIKDYTINVFNIFKPLTFLNRILKKNADEVISQMLLYTNFIM